MLSPDITFMGTEKACNFNLKYSSGWRWRKSLAESRKPHGINADHRITGIIKTL
jgi:hypothetical protein